jgi:rsbT co-antagonist protein RsbR
MSWIETESTASASELMDMYQITSGDLDNVRVARGVVAPRLDDFIGRFYAWLEPRPEYEEFFSDTETLERVRRHVHRYWLEFLDSQVDDAYVDSRRRVGQTHARIGLNMHIYLAAMNVYNSLTTSLLSEVEMEVDSAEVIASVTRVLHLDTAIVAQTYMAMVTETIAAQGKSLMEMSTPVTEIWEGVLMMPIVGIVDSQRSQDIMNAMLTRISETQAGQFILDIGGVAVVDTAVANHLIKMTKATALMGCRTTISGISPAIAQTMVELGIDVGTVRTTATMRDALSQALELRSE